MDIPKKVLVIEDDTFILSLISKKLSSSGFTLFTATNGQDALTIINKEMPDIVLADIMLPGMTGFEILKSMKVNETTKKIPVFMLSNLGEKADIDKAMMLGAAKFFVKATASLDEVVGEIKKLYA